MTYYLVDYENVGFIGLSGIHNLSKRDSVYVFYSETSKSINLNALTGVQAKIEFINVKTGTPHALDFQLIAFLFKNIRRKSTYCIVSKDKGYEVIFPMVESEKSQIERRERIDGITSPRKTKSELSQIIMKKGVNKTDIPRTIEDKIGFVISAKTGITFKPEVISQIKQALEKSCDKQSMYQYCTAAFGQSLGIDTNCYYKVLVTR